MSGDTDGTVSRDKDVVTDVRNRVLFGYVRRAGCRKFESFIVFRFVCVVCV